MSCPFERDVLLLADGDLPFGRRIVVEAHLAVCRSCAAIEETLDVVEHQLRNGPAAPLGVVDPALARIAAPAPLRPLLLGGLVAAAAAALVVAVFRPSTETTRREPTVVDVRTPAPGGVTLPPPVPPEALARRVARLPVGDVDAAEELAALVRGRGAAGTSALAGLLGDRDPEIVARALAVAERAPSPRLARRLIALLDEPEFAARAARLLGIAGDDRAVPALAARLDGEAGVEAREALVAIGGRSATQAIAARFAASPRAALLDALARLDPALAAREMVRARADYVRAVLERRASKLVPELRRLCRDEAYAPGAARALGWARDPEAIPLLAEMARRRVAAREAAAALLAYETPEATRRALRAYRLGAAPDDVAAAFAGREAAESHLLAIVGEGRANERVAALELLAHCGGPRTMEALRPMRLQGGALAAAVDTVAAIGGPQAVSTLAAWRGRAPRRPLIAALGATREPGAVELLVEYGDSAEVCAALGRIHTTASAGRLIDILLKRRFAREAGVALRGMPVRVVVPELLARFENPGASRALRRVLRDIAGTDLGSRIEPWQRWWDSRP